MTEDSICHSTKVLRMTEFAFTSGLFRKCRFEAYEKAGGTLLSISGWLIRVLQICEGKLKSVKNS